MEDQRRCLLWHGLFLFLLGLTTGLFEQHFTNTRMALAAHLEGLMNGTFLLALGAAWNEVTLPMRLKATTYRLFLVGTYGNWAVTTLAAILGTAALSPITAAGHNASPVQEMAITVGFVAVGLTILAGTVLALWGLRNRWPTA